MVGPFSAWRKSACHDCRDGQEAAPAAASFCAALISLRGSIHVENRRPRVVQERGKDECVGPFALVPPVLTQVGLLLHAHGRGEPR